MASIEPKPFASLSSGLLARKGAARPAMKPQGFNQMGAAGGNLEDLGWDDMGFEAPKPHIAPRDGAHDAFGEEIDDQTPVHHPTGLTPVHINRTLKALEQEGLIERPNPRAIWIGDWRKLADAGDFDSNYLHLREDDHSLQ